MSTSAAPAAPIANGNRKKLRFTTSATAKTTATISQITHESTCRLDVPTASALVTRARRQRHRAGARAKSSASNGRRSSSASPMPISLTGMPSSPRDRQRDPALGGAVELGEHDPVDRHRLGEQLGLAQAVLAGGGVDGQQRLVRRARRAACRSRGAPSSARPSDAPGCAGGRRCRRSTTSAPRSRPWRRRRRRPSRGPSPRAR